MIMMYLHNNIKRFVTNKAFIVRAFLSCYYVAAPGRNYEQIEVRERFLSFGAEYFVFHFAIEKFKD
jgi:hypothetical protein